MCYLLYANIERREQFSSKICGVERLLYEWYIHRVRRLLYEGNIHGLRLRSCVRSRQEILWV